jgi:dTDP-4-dehydrorhamnose 3,5-epimerase
MPRAEAIAGVRLIEPAVSADERGWFAQLYEERELASAGLTGRFVRSALSCNRRAFTLRGLHFQRPPHGDAKLVMCITGALFDVVADVTPGSPTYGCWMGFELSAANRRVLAMPAGTAHGFLTLVPDTTVLYHISAYYVPGSGAGVRWDDPTLAIDWPAVPAVLSDQDRNWGLLLP